ncbi:hypothetical protein RvY_06516 [Ramazzottius varieornatus]|uniref:Uncharacterized protein n=1 Tax=Ramazzottius varieornatus TaxID=947166 RepID=A0A1D1UYX5_RAMVA|nr:hypothetical protein RvY_06516 [Ramazzottius varieornatus]
MDIGISKVILKMLRPLRVVTKRTMVPLVEIYRCSGKTDEVYRPYVWKHLFILIIQGHNIMAWGTLRLHAGI